MKNSSPILVYVTVPKLKIAKSIAAALLSKRLIACANILPKSISLYLWKGKREKTKESILLMKTSDKHFKAIEKYVLSAHPY